MVYFIRYKTPNCPIKIGYTEDEQRLAGRLRAISTAAPWDVEGLAVAHRAGPAAERELHRLFAKHRSRGEWFKPSIPVLQIVAYAKANPFASAGELVNAAREIVGEPVSVTTPMRKMSRSRRKRLKREQLAHLIATGEVKIKSTREAE